jgi:hypothetical protein
VRSPSNPYCDNLLLDMQAWCKENGTTDKLTSIRDAPKAGRFLDAWCSGRWVSYKNNTSSQLLVIKSAMHASSW